MPASHLLFAFRAVTVGCAVAGGRGGGARAAAVSRLRPAAARHRDGARVRQHQGLEGRRPPPR
eukprot:2212316-Rhodomonas_salina.4